MHDIGKDALGNPVTYDQFYITYNSGRSQCIGRLVNYNPNRIGQYKMATMQRWQLEPSSQSKYTFYTYCKSYQLFPIKLPPSMQQKFNNAKPGY